MGLPLRSLYPGVQTQTRILRHASSLARAHHRLGQSLSKERRPQIRIRLRQITTQRPRLQAGTRCRSGSRTSFPRLARLDISPSPSPVIVLFFALIAVLCTQAKAVLEQFQVLTISSLSNLTSANKSLRFNSFIGDWVYGKSQFTHSPEYLDTFIFCCSVIGCFVWG